MSCPSAKPHSRSTSTNFTWRSRQRWSNSDPITLIRLHPSRIDGQVGSNGKTRMPEPTKLLFPKWHRELFNAILDETKLKTDREGQSRTAYSLRHTWVCLRVVGGADMYQIAKNCRTSAERIRKFYAYRITTRLDAAPSISCAR